MKAFDAIIIGSGQSGPFPARLTPMVDAIKLLA